MTMLKIAKVLAKPLLTALQASTLYFVKTGNEYKTDVYFSTGDGQNLLDVSSERLRQDTVRKYSPEFNPLVLGIAYKDTTSAITSGTNVAYLRSPRSFILKHIRASVYQQSTSGNVTMRVKVNGVDINPDSTLTVEVNETSSLTAAVNYNATLPVNGINIQDDDVISIDVISAGLNATALLVQLHEGIDPTFTYTA
jgi:hypothetical protein